MTKIKNRINQIITKAFGQGLIYLAIGTFLLGIGIRLLPIFGQPFMDKWIDLSIYIEGGQLVSNGLNPYDFNENPELRKQLRLDDIAYDGWVSATQERWDFYASGNLPLSLLYYGAIDKIFSSDTRAFRIIFALIDALLGVLVLLFCIKYWRLKPTIWNLGLYLGIATISPTLLLSGTIFPEDKGLQILLMLAAIYSAKDKRWIWSAIFLGCSIAFKGLGAFIAPLCMYFAIGEPKHLLNVKSYIRPAITYTLMTTIACFIWIVPYMPEVFQMMTNRMDKNLDAIPEYASIWILAAKFFPDGWAMIRTATLLLTGGLFAYVFLIKKFNPTILFAFLLVFFVDILLLRGSIDRMNIGIIVSLVLFGLVDIQYAKILGWYTVIGGSLVFLDFLSTRLMNETVDATYALGYVLLFCTYPIVYLIRQQTNTQIATSTIEHPNLN